MKAKLFFILVIAFAIAVSTNGFIAKVTNLTLSRQKLFCLYSYFYCIHTATCGKVQQSDFLIKKCQENKN